MHGQAQRIGLGDALVGSGRCHWVTGRPCLSFVWGILFARCCEIVAQNLSAAPWADSETQSLGDKQMSHERSPVLKRRGLPVVDVRYSPEAGLKRVLSESRDRRRVALVPVGQEHRHVSVALH
jgi:hypothetical protein